jgi:hypothetical protein
MVRGRFWDCGGLMGRACLLLSVKIQLAREESVFLRGTLTLGGIDHSPSCSVSLGAERVRRYETPDTKRRVSSMTAL